MQSADLPPCENIVLPIIRDTLRKAKPTSSLTVRSAETLLYRVSLQLLDSPVHRSPTGTLNKHGEQLLLICQNCLSYYLHMGWITEKEHHEHMEYLKTCELDFEKYSCI